MRSLLFITAFPRTDYKAKQAVKAKAADYFRSGCSALPADAIEYDMLAKLKKTNCWYWSRTLTKFVTHMIPQSKQWFPQCLVKHIGFHSM